LLLRSVRAWRSVSSSCTLRNAGLQIISQVLAEIHRQPEWVGVSVKMSWGAHEISGHTWLMCGRKQEDRAPFGIYWTVSTAYFMYEYVRTYVQLKRLYASTCFAHLHMANAYNRLII
jgi:hypothetical protein